MAHRTSRRQATTPRAEKICETCARPFAWRKKWERDWENVRYCSDACRRGRNNPDFQPR